MHYFIDPSFEEGSLRPSKKCNATLKWAERGRSEALLQQWSALPGCARSKVAVHLSYGRSLPLPKGGERLVENETPSRRNS